MGPYVLRKGNVGKELMVVPLSAVLALGHFYSILLSQGTSVNVISLPWNDVFSKALPSFSSM